MRRPAYAAITAALLATLTACGGELVHAPGGTRAGPITAPSDLSAGGECVTRIDVFDTGELLRPEQVLAAADQGAGQISGMYVLSPSNCGTGVGYTAPRCDEGFPWTGPGDDDIGDVLGPIGVTSLVTSTIRYETPAATVTETVLTLSGASGSILENFAGVCGFPQIDTGVYEADLGSDSFMLLQINDGVAVGVEFDDTGLGAPQRRDILAAAVAQLPPA